MSAAWAITALTAGCGQGQTAAGDAGQDALVIPADATRDAAILNNYLGSWTVQGTQIQDCGGPAQTVANSGSLVIERGTYTIIASTL